MVMEDILCHSTYDKNTNTMEFMYVKHCHLKRPSWFGGNNDILNNGWKLGTLSFVIHTYIYAVVFVLYLFFVGLLKKMAKKRGQRMKMNTQQAGMTWALLHAYMNFILEISRRLGIIVTITNNNKNKWWSFMKDWKHDKKILKKEEEGFFPRRKTDVW